MAQNLKAGLISERSNRPLSAYGHIDVWHHDGTMVLVHIMLDRDFIFRAGQYIWAALGHEPAQPYSLAAPPRGRRIECHIQAEQWDKVNQPYQGQCRQIPVAVDGPHGDAYFRHHSGPLIGVSGGSGLAPIKAVIEHALATGHPEQIVLYHGVRRAEHVYLQSFWDDLAAKNNNLTYWPVVSEETSDRAWRHGLVVDVVAQDWSAMDHCQVYMAGPPAMVERGVVLFGENGLPINQLHCDGLDRRISG